MVLPTDQRAAWDPLLRDIEVRLHQLHQLQPTERWGLMVAGMAAMAVAGGAVGALIVCALAR